VIGIPQHILAPDPTLYLRGKWLSTDFETTGIDKGTALNPDNRLILASWETSGDRSIFVGDIEKEGEGKEYLSHLFKDLDECDFFVAQNAKFELQWLKLSSSWYLTP